MANIGEVLTAPESGMQRIDDTNLNIKYNGNWQDYDKEGISLHYTDAIDDCVTFYVKSNKINIYDMVNRDNRSNIIEIYINDEFVGNINELYPNTEKDIPYMCVYSNNSLNDKVNKIKIINKSENSFSRLGLQCIDIDEDGYMCTKEEYELQEAKNRLFPVRVANDTVTTEENVANYTATLTNGERQLLLLNNGEMYLSDGKGSHIKMGSGNNCFIKASYFGDPTV